VAKILSHMHSIIRGSVGGVTYTANSAAQIVARARTVPVNPQTNYQTSIRSAFAQGSGFWKQLTDAARAEWNAYAQTLTYQGALGPYQVPGRNVFIAMSSIVTYINNRVPGTLVPSTVAPTVGGFLDIGDITVNPAGSGNTGFVLSVSNFTGVDIVLFAERSIGFNASRVSPPARFDASTFDVLPITAGNFGSLEFSGLTADVVYFAKCRAITDAGPYRFSTEYVVRAVANTTP
jgi:hypothetical protein